MTVTFTEPEQFSGISIKGDETGNQDVISLEFSGIPASLPKSSSSELSLLFSLFSDDIASKIATLSKDSFKISEISSKDGNEMAEVFFVENNKSYNIVYEIKSGIPYSIDAGNDELSVHIELANFIQTTE